MRWRGGRRSANIEDRRGMGRRVAMRFPGGGLGGAGRAGLGGGVGLIVLVLAALFFGIDPGVLLDDGGPVPGGGSPGYYETPAEPAPPRSAAEEELAEFVSVVLAETEDTWGALFDRMGATYRDPTLVLFTGAVESACGFAQAAMGPFYCPADERVYIDLSFYDDLRSRLGAPGDFAEAYVIAHEVGHHVQNLLGISEQVQAARAQAGVGGAEANALSVRLELQADCFAGLWAHRADRERQILEEGDIEEGLDAASAVGDDRLQRRSQGYVVPESFTHGSSEQRVGWFRRGLEAGELEACDTFSADAL